MHGDNIIGKVNEELDIIGSSLNRLESLGQTIPALDRNLKRIRASFKMIELNFTDLSPNDTGKPMEAHDRRSTLLEPPAGTGGPGTP